MPTAFEDEVRHRVEQIRESAARQAEERQTVAATQHERDQQARAERIRRVKELHAQATEVFEAAQQGAGDLLSYRRLSGQSTAEHVLVWLGAGKTRTDMVTFDWENGQMYRGAMSAGSIVNTTPVGRVYFEDLIRELLPPN